MNAIAKEVVPRRELLIGCGNRREKALTGDLIRPEWEGLVTLDASAAAKPDVVHDLDVLPYPFEDNTFDEIHAVEVLEHCGRQGDWRFFFAQFAELWRIMKPDGLFVATVPMWNSPWAWGDPGHTRVLPKEIFTFLDQRQYAEVGQTACSDYREVWKGNFRLLGVSETRHRLGVLLQAVK